MDARNYIRINSYGIQKYIMKENIELRASNLLQHHPDDGYFSDLRWALQTEIPFNRKRVISEMKTKILSSSRVLKAIETETQKRLEAGGASSKAGVAIRA